KLTAQRGQSVGGSKQKNNADGEAVDSPPNRAPPEKPRPMQTRSKDAPQRSCHQRVHQNKAESESHQPHKSMSRATQARRQQKKHQLARSLRAQPVQDAEHKNGAAVVAPGEGLGPRCIAVETPSNAPP